MISFYELVRPLLSQIQFYIQNSSTLTLNLLTTTIVAPPSNASKWQMGFNLLAPEFGI